MMQPLRFQIDQALGPRRKARRRSATDAALVCAVWLISSLCFVACNQDDIRFDPRGFRSPRDLAFACIDSDARRGVPLAQCLNRPLDSPLRVTAVLTEADRGELATADLSNNNDLRLLDTEVAVPGFTFQPVAELPSGVAVLDGEAQSLIVASAAERVLEVYPLLNARPDFGPVNLTPQRVPIDGAPRSVARIAGEDALMLVLPDLAIFSVFSFDSGANEVSRLSLGGAVTEALPPAAATSLSPYVRSCTPLAQPAQLPAGVGAPPFRPPSGPLVATPGSLVFDPDGRRAFVTDERLPVIYEIAFDAAYQSTLRVIQVGVPQRALAVTPTLPVSLEEGAPSQVLYAIDNTDGSVFAVEVHPEHPDRDALLPVSALPQRAYRMDLGAAAESLAVVSPSAQGERCDDPSSTLGVAAQGAQLRGIFLAVGLLDARIQLIDIVDRDALCRGTQVCGGNPQSGIEVAYAMQRHRPRLAQNVTQLPTLSRQPSFAAEGGRTRIAFDGVTDLPAAPRLESLAACPSGQSIVYPPLGVNEPPLICALADVWEDQAQNWTIRFEGSLPGTEDRLGRLRTSSEGWQVESAEGRFCERGVLGAAQAAALSGRFASSSGDYGGDLVALRASEAQVRSLEPSDPCRTLLEGDDGTPRVFLFPARDTFSDRVTINATSRLGVPAETLAFCAGETLRFEVRADAAFMVAGSVGGAPSVLRALSSGRCEVDSNLAFSADNPMTWIRSRAFAGETFANQQVAFRISADRNTGEPTAIPGRVVVLEFSVDNRSRPLEVDLVLQRQSRQSRGSLPAILRYNAGDRRLYVVDTIARRMWQVTLQPLRVTGRVE